MALGPTHTHTLGPSDNSLDPWTRLERPIGTRLARVTPFTIWARSVGQLVVVVHSFIHSYWFVTRSIPFDLLDQVLMVNDRIHLDSGSKNLVYKGTVANTITMRSVCVSSFQQYTHTHTKKEGKYRTEGLAIHRLQGTTQWHSKWEAIRMSVRVCVSYVYVSSVSLTQAIIDCWFRRSGGDRPRRWRQTRLVAQINRIRRPKRIE